MAMTAEPVDPLWRRPLTAPAPVVSLAPRASADVRQAQAFITLLEEEMADLQSQLARIEERVRAGRAGANHHQSAVQLRLTEVRRLLDALIYRFPSA
jgi:ParB-like chromosome segregation protein Spo0J